MRIGVTATRKGLSERQKTFFREYISRGDQLHHGDCIGGDAELDRIAEEMGVERVAHPCDLAGQRAYCDAEIVLSPARPLERNRHIVDGSQVILAFPSSRTEERRSGTWATIRYARKRGATLHIIYP
jgi:hypothetical protein